MDRKGSPNPEWCVPLLTGTEGSSVVEPLAVIKRVLGECSHSGAYVDYGARVLGQSIQCFFFRHARIHVSAVLAHESGTTPEFINYVWRLVDDYKLIADKLAAVNEPFMNVVQLATFFHDVAKGSVSFDYDKVEDSGAKRDVVPAANAGALPNHLIKEGQLMYKTIDNNFNSLCAVKSKRWFDADTNEFVDMKPFKFKAKEKTEKKEKKVKDPKDNKKASQDVGSTSTAQNDELKKKEQEKKKEKKEKEGSKVESMVRLNRLQTIMRNMFEKLLFKKLPDECWTQMFANVILIKSSEIVQIQQDIHNNMSEDEPDDELLNFLDE